MSDKVLETVKLDARDQKALRRVAAFLKVPRANVLRWAIRYYAIYGPCWRPKDTLPREILDMYGVTEIGPGGQEVRK